MVCIFWLLMKTKYNVMVLKMKEGVYDCLGFTFCLKCLSFKMTLSILSAQHGELV